MLATLKLLIALVGHSALWIAAVNRVHAVGFRREVKDRWTNFFFALLVGIPLLVLWRWWSLGSLHPQGVVGDQTLLAKYLSVCVPLAFYATAKRVWYKFGGERQGVMTAHTVQTVDLGANGGTERLLSPGAALRFAQLPGNQLLRLSVEEKTLQVPNLPPGLDGLKIAHLADLHMSGRIGSDYYAQIVDLTNEWGPDLVALTGDLVENVPTLDTIAPTIGRLTAPSGVYFVLGNHDDHGDADELRRRLTAHGHIDLGGRWQDLDIKNTKLRLAGNERPWFYPAADLASATVPADVTLALVHSPDQITWSRRHGVSLVLAGHNHGGQICLPIVGPIVTPSLHGVRYASGVFRHGQTVMHVTRGSGTLAPIRWNCPPELALLTLRPATTAT